MGKQSISEVAAAIVLLTGGALPVSAATLAHSGRLLDALDLPVTTTVQARFRLFSQPVSGVAPWDSGACGVPVRGGLYTVTLGADCGAAIPDALVHTSDARWLEVEIGGVVLAPRQAVSAVPLAQWALQSQDAQALRTQLGSAGVVNTTSNPVDFSQLKSVPAVLLADASASSKGLLSSADYQRFDGKLTTVSVSSPLTGNGTAGSPLSIHLPNATGGATGVLSATDFQRFEEKLTTVSVSSPLTGNGTAVSPLSINLPNATASVTGALSATDYQRFDSKVSDVTAGAGLSVTRTGNSVQVALSSSTDLGRAPRFVAGFKGDIGPDLSPRGYSQCYGWKNDGNTPVVGWTAIRDACGAGRQVIFAGYRSGSYRLVEHQAELVRPLSYFMPATAPTSSTQQFFDNFDMEGKYTWMYENNWLVLGRLGNRWGDPGRLWEPCYGCGTPNADAGHVLSENGGDANDQASTTGDRYFIYMQPVRAVVPQTCKTLLQANPSLTNGAYDLRLDGVNPTRVYCDMSGGGWTLVSNQVPGSLLANDYGDVYSANFGNTASSWRVGHTTTAAIEPTEAWRMTDGSTNVYFKPTCRVDWARSYFNTGRSLDCNTGYTSASFTSVTNGGFVDAAIRGIGINNGGQNCSMRIFNDVLWTTPSGNTLQVGQSGNCLGASNTNIQLWFR